MISITKRVSLDFLGEEYKDSYLNLKSITMREYGALQDEAKKLEGDNEASTNYITKQIIDRFEDGKVKDQAVTEEDLLELPPEVFINAYTALIGVESPKV